MRKQFFGGILLEMLGDYYLPILYITVENDKKYPIRKGIEKSHELFSTEMFSTIHVHIMSKT